MIFGPFVTHSFSDAKIAFSVFKQRGLIGKRFSSRLSLLSPYKQLSDWLVLLRLLDTIYHKGSADVSIVVNSRSRSILLLPDQVFCIYEDYREYDIRAKVNRNAYYEEAPISWMLYDTASDCFQKLLIDYRSRVSNDIFERDISRLENENNNDY